MPPKIDADSPFSVNIPPKMMLRLIDESKKLGDLPIGAVIRIAITEWLATRERRGRRKKKLEAQQQG